MGKAVRLDKFLADSGAGTRTEVKKLIQKGMVQVNGETAKKPELKVDPERDVVEFGGERLGARAEFVYYLLHKPAGYVSATEDIREKTVLELVPKDGRRNLFPVGRLDKDTEGLLLITDDGQLAHQLLPCRSARIILRGCWSRLQEVNCPADAPRLVPMSRCPCHGRSADLPEYRGFQCNP